jgi:APA family basic amino acid/polyamine antiporter
VTAILGILICLAQMVALPRETWERLIIWMAVGIVIYFGYGFWFSKLRQPAAVGANGGSAESTAITEKKPERF